jgi:hypothetical protein
MYIGRATPGIHCRRIASNRVLAMVTMACPMFIGTSASAIGSPLSPTMTKHQKVVQMENCMRTRMSASKTIWYNEAAKICKDQIDKQRDNSTSSALVASAAPAKQ